MRHLEEQPRFIVALGEARIEEEQAAVGQEQVVPGQADGKFRVRRWRNDCAGGSGKGGSSGVNEARSRERCSQA